MPRTMQSSNSVSLFQDLKARELNGFRVRKTPHLGNLSSDCGGSGSGSGVMMIEHDGDPSPPLAMSFCKMTRNHHFLAVSDEDGYISFYDTCRKLPSFASCRQHAVEARVCEWVAHHNAIFDVCWMKGDTQILTASGDQTVKLWDVEKKACISIMMEHKGSVKSLCSHPSNADVVVSGSRDGSFALWDFRCKSSSKNRHGEPCLLPSVIVEGAHTSYQGRQTGRGPKRHLKAANMSITSVLYLKDEFSIASAGAVDSVVKFWDTRSLKVPVVQTCPHIEQSVEKERVQHGISSLSQDSTGVFLAASCMDNSIYLYNALQLDKGPLKTFSGSRIESFYVKSAISPDASHILSGSSDGNAYIWQVKRPEVGPIILKGHEGEVTAVSWCPSEAGKIATAADDFMVRIWNTEKGSCLYRTSPSCMRRRVTAIPSIECRRLFMDEPTSDPAIVSRSSPPGESLTTYQSPNQIKTPEIGTPDCVRKRSLSDMSLDLETQKTPEDAMKSPSSVLNPPSSLKRRTIRDYFIAGS